MITYGLKKVECCCSSIMHWKIKAHAAGLRTGNPAHLSIEHSLKMSTLTPQ